MSDKVEKKKTEPANHEANDSVKDAAHRTEHTHIPKTLEKNRQESFESGTLVSPKDKGKYTPLQLVDGDEVLHDSSKKGKLKIKSTKPDEVE